MILFFAIIPITLRVNLYFSKTRFTHVINKYDSIPETIARNSSIPEELGRISYVFSDKTGTLTKNQMIFKKISLTNENFGEGDFEKLEELLSEECKKNDATLLDIYNMTKDNNIQNEVNGSVNESKNSDLNSSKEIKRKKIKLEEIEIKL